MQVEYLTLADAANLGEGGKINILGLGTRLLNYEKLPGISPMVVLAAVSAMTTEAGDYPIELIIVEPDGTEETIVTTVGHVNNEVEDSRVPTGIGMSVDILRPFRIEGVHSLRLTVGELKARYDFVVRVRAPKTSAGDGSEVPVPKAAKPRPRAKPVKPKATEA